MDTEPELQDGQIWMGDSDYEAEGVDDEVGTSREEFWNQAMEEHRARAVGEHGDGGLEVEKDFMPPDHLLRQAWADDGALVGEELPSGPRYATVEDNPVEFRDKKQEWMPGGIHEQVDEWRRLKPRVDEEVLAWV